MMKQTKKPGVGFGGFVAALSVLVLAVGICGGIYQLFSASEPAASPPQDNSAANAEARRQAEKTRISATRIQFEATIANASRDGFIDSLTVGNSIGTLIAGSRFPQLKYEDKQNIADACFASCRLSCIEKGGDCQALIILDSYNHREIGEFSLTGGFSLK